MKPYGVKWLHLGSSLNNGTNNTPLAHYPLGGLGRMLTGGLIGFCVGWLPIIVLAALSSDEGDIGLAAALGAWVGFFTGAVPGFVVGAIVGLVWRQ